MKQKSICLCIFLCGFIAPRTYGQSYEATIDRWRAQLNGDNWQAIADSCDKLMPLLASAQRVFDRSLAFSLLGSAYRIGGKPALALGKHQEALRLRKGIFGPNHEDVARSQQNIGNCLVFLNQYGAAKTAFGEALRIKKRYFPPDHPRMVNTYIGLGQCLLNEGDRANASVFLQKALSITAAESGDESPELIEILLSMAELRAAQGYPEAAVGLLQRAKQIYDKNGLNDPGLQINLTNNLANVLSAKGDYRESIKLLDEALVRCEQQPKLPPDLKGNALLNKGICLSAVGDYAESALVLRSALDVFKTTGPARASALNALGLTAYYQNDIELARKTLIEAGNMYLQSEQNASNQTAAAGVWRNLGNCFFALDEFDTALHYYQDALNAMQQWAGTDQQQAACLDKMARCLIERRQWDEAWAALKQAELKTASRSGNSIGLFPIFFHRGELFFRQKKWPEALSWYQKALQIVESPLPTAFPPFAFEQIQAQSAVARTLSAQAQAGANDKWPQVLRTAEAAIGLLQHLKSVLQGERSVVEIQALLGEPYDLAVRACYALGDKQKAWQFSEQFKLNYAQQISLNAALHQLEGPAAELARAEQQLRRRLAFFQGLKAASTDELTLNDSIQSVSQRLLIIKKQLTDNYADFFQYFLTPQTFGLADAQAALASKQCILAWHWADSNQLIGFVIRKDGFVAKNIFLPKGTLDSIQQFFFSCSQNPQTMPSTQRDAAFAKQLSLGQNLYRLLFQPFEHYLTENILIVPDDLLCLLPFDALVVKPGGAARFFDRHDYLLHHYQISYIQSVSSWLLLKKSPKTPFQNRLLSLAPDFTNNRHKLPVLQFNGKEASAVGKATEGTVLLGPDAHKHRFLALASGCNILHLATHGVTDDQNPQASFVAFSTVSNNDDRLFAAEIYNHRFNCDLVVLSACQTASGKLYRGEGLLSVAKAFQYAGARCVLASLWNVDDRQTPELIRDFYLFLWKKQPKNQALALARRAFLTKNKGVMAHPFFWAGFVCQGDESALQIPSDWSIYGYAGAALLVLLGLALLLRKKKGLFR